jgi:hypothetical protein
MSEMSKRKNNRKGRRAAKQTERELEQIRPLHTPVEAAKDSQTTARNTHDKRNNKQENPMGFREFFKQPYVTNWLLAFFTLALTVTAIYQYKITANQLDVMRKDERAWLQVKSQIPFSKEVDQPFQLEAGKDLTFPLVLSNIGKTPAKNIVVVAFVKTRSIYEVPPLECVDQGNTCTPNGASTGILFPNDHFDFPSVRVDQNGNIKVTDQEFTAWKEGQIYAVVFGKVTYDDAFGLSHWTKFCSWHLAKLGMLAKTRPCAQYSDAN